MLYTGIDLHKRTAVIATVDEKGKLVSEASLPTSRAAVARYFHLLPAAPPQNHGRDIGLDDPQDGQGEEGCRESLTPRVRRPYSPLFPPIAFRAASKLRGSTLVLP